MPRSIAHPKNANIPLKNIATIEFRRENQNAGESRLENIMNIKETPRNESKQK